MAFDPRVYRLASIARDKLCREAARASHDLRILVAHANILDELMIELNAPGGASADYYGFEVLPREVPPKRSARRSVVVTVRESSEDESEDEGRLEHSSNLSSESSPSGLPMLSHDSESDSDSASDSDDSDDSDDFSTVITPTSPTDTSSTAMSPGEDDGVKSDEGGIGLRRIKTVLRLFRGTSTSSEGQQKQLGTNSNVVRLALSSV